MSLSPLRGSASALRVPTQDISSVRPSPVQQRPGAGGLSGLKGLQQDGFDSGLGKNNVLGKLLEGTMELINTLTQLQQAIQGGAAGGLEGAKGVEGAKGAAGAPGACGKKGFSDSAFSDSSFTPSAASDRAPVELNPGETGVPLPGVRGGSRMGANLPPALEKLRPQIEAAAAKTGVPAEMLAAQIWAESRGKVDATSTNGGNGMTDTGLMQVNPNTFRGLQEKYPELQGKNLSDPATNILAGACYMKDMKEQFGNWDLALRAYNSGPSGVDRSNPDAIPAGLGSPSYVRDVNSFMKTLSTGEGQLPG
ncbi:lytic transglycosylase domain-containing protein [Pyxidicoccus sp. 3LFB2]